MKQFLPVVLGLFLGVVLSMPNSAYAQEKKGKDAENRLSGVVQAISKDNRTITLRMDGTAQRVVVWDAKTAWTYDNKPGSINELKEGRRAIARGKFNDRNQLEATRIELTEERSR